jgi:uncharacterized SAM-binding protein YcdF (DUF218 family)
VGVKATLALVVPGQSRRDHISASCRRLVAEAEVLAARLRPATVVFSGWSPRGGVSEAEQMRELWGGPEVELVVEPTAATTAQNAARTLPLLLERSITSAVVVCTPLHRYRVRWFFRRLYEAHGIETSFHAARIPPTPLALAWELGALTVRSRQLRAAKSELARAAERG